MGADKSKTVVELSPKYVLFSPLDDERIVLMLPILPQLIVFNDPAYKAFVSDFEQLFIDTITGEDSNLVGVMSVHHKQLIFKFEALSPFIDACTNVKKVVIVPYCPEEGIPDQDVFGGEIEVISKV